MEIIEPQWIVRRPFAQDQKLLAFATGTALRRCFASVLARCGFAFNLFRCPVVSLRSAATLGRRQPALHPWTRVIETAAFTRRMGRKLKTICDDLGAQFVFKASYDKANRPQFIPFAEPMSRRVANSSLRSGRRSVCLYHRRSIRRRRSKLPRGILTSSKFRLPLPSDRSHCRGRSKRARCQREKRTVSRAFGSEKHRCRNCKVLVAVRSLSPNAAPPSATITWWPICARFTGCNNWIFR